MVNVCLISSEVVPFAKTGGLADVASALPRFLGGEGHRVQVVMPLYRRIREAATELQPIDGMQSVPIGFGKQEIRFAAYRGPSLGKGADVYFVGNPQLYDRDELYGYSDDPVRFGLLSRAAIVMSQWLQWQPEIFHCNDWHTSLVPLYMKTLYAWDRVFENTRTVLTLHNIGYQGTFPSEVIDEVGLADVKRQLFQEDLQKGQINFLKTGLMYADALTTVSETYAKEIRTAEFGAGLEQILEARHDVLFGIVNGVDYGEWDPATDALLPFRYSAEDMSGKAKNKEALLERFSLSGGSDVPVLGVVSRLTGQKGFELLPDILPVLLHQRDLRLIILGSGEEKYERFFNWLAETFSDKVGFHCGYDNELAHWIEAGSDMFLMPSRYEPCGLNQLYSMKYGTVPIVRRTGGLADTVQQWDPKDDSGTGFLFDEFEPKALLDATIAALAVFEDREAWQAIVRNGMAEDWSWRRQGRHYVELYRRLTM